MSKTREADGDFVMYLNSGNRGTHPLEPGVITVHLAFLQELEICHAHFAGRNSPLQAIARGPSELLLSRLPPTLKWIIFAAIWWMADGCR